MLEIVTPKITSPNYFYSFGYQFSKSRLGVAHGDDVIYLFNLSFGSNEIPDVNTTTADLLMSKIMVDFWTSFAING